VLTAAFPDHLVSEATIRRFLAKERKKNPALFVLARDGESALWRDYIPKTTNDVSAPNERWQSDGRYLPIYVQYGGHPSRVALVSILDDKSRYVPAWCLVPRQEQDELGDLHTVDFTGEHVRMLFASAMYKTQTRPRVIYTDNGSQFKALEPRMKYLTDEAEPPIEVIHTKPGRPQGRGKMERALGQIDTFLHGLPGYVEDEDDAMCWKRAREAPNLLTFEELEANLKQHFEHWNTVSQNGKPSRFQVWQSSTVSLPAPTPIRLALLADASEIIDASVSDLGIRYKNKHYMIIPKEPEDYQRWTRLVGQKVPLCAIPMEKETLIVVTLDGRKWEPVVPIAIGRPSKQKHNHFQQAVVKQLKGELAVVREQFRMVIIDVCGAMPKLDALTQEVFFGDRTGPSNDKHDAPPQSKDEAPADTPAASAEDASHGTIQAPAQTAEPAVRPAVADRAPGLTQVPTMAELRQALKDRQASKGNKQ
jgi:transposase InsO family protein